MQAISSGREKPKSLVAWAQPKYSAIGSTPILEYRWGRTMDPEDLSRLWESVRNGDPDVYGALVTVTELASLRLRHVAGEAPPLLPPHEERAALWETGRLAYEVSLALTGRIETGWGITPHSDSEKAAELIARLADAARILPWPEYAPHSLGAIRAEALAESKHDTIGGFTNAWAFHREARRRLEDYEESLIGADKDYATALHETAIQLALSEAGTACRTAERVISQWAEGIDGASEDAWITQLYQQLSEGAEFGEASLTRVRELEDGPGLVKKVTRKRMAQETAYRNPGIMTARALLLLVPLCTEMSRMGYHPPPDYETWEKAQEGLLKRFADTFELIGADVARHRPFSEEHTRSLVQLRLNYAWLAPGQSLAVVGPIDEIPCLASNPLNDEAISELSDWLTQHDFDGNAIASATMPCYVRAVQQFSSHDAYVTWRHDNHDLDRYRKVKGRRKRVTELLDEIVPRPGTVRVDPDLHERAKAAVGQVDSNLNTRVAAFLRWLVHDTDDPPQRPPADTNLMDSTTS